ncbi:hypothetical protein J6590_057836 [Homalodisca vitripennis]|nr:hypothetical protein J6590_057836 [Homalodisca vitripennis]
MELNYCELYVRRHEADNTFYKSILWSDEATFKLNCRVKRHNVVYWDSVYPHLFIQTELNAPGVCVWLESLLEDEVQLIGLLITPMDFSIWGIVKGKVYLEKPRDLQQLRERIESLFEELSTKAITDTKCASVTTNKTRRVGFPLPPQTRLWMSPTVFNGKSVT